MNQSEDQQADDFVEQFMSGRSQARKSEADSAAPARTAEDETASGSLEEQVIAALKEVYDPEIPVNIYDLGLIYDIRIEDGGKVEIDMTLTTPGCPIAASFPDIVERAVGYISGVTDAKVELVWDPPWTPERMTEAVRLELGLM